MVYLVTGDVGHSSKSLFNKIKDMDYRVKVIIGSSALIGAYVLLDPFYTDVTICNKIEENTMHYKVIGDVTGDGVKDLETITLFDTKEIVPGVKHRNGSTYFCK